MRRVLAIVLAAAGAVGCASGDSAPVQPQTTTPDVSAATQPAAAPTAIEPLAQAPAVRPAPAPKPPRRTTQAPPPAPAPDFLATVDGIRITRQRIVDTVMESHGLNMLLRVVQVEMAKELAAKEGVDVTPEDISKERALTLDQLFKDANQTTLDEIAELEADGNLAKATQMREQLAKDNESLLPQLLVKQNMTMGEFDLLMQSNAHLRKLTQKQVAGKLTEQNVYEAFLNIYGENVRVRHIQLNNIAEVTEAQNRLANGTAFEEVARSMSRNPTTRELGGELLPFSRETQNLPDSFKQVAFLLNKPGQVSDPVEANGAYHLIQLIERLAPKAVRFEDVKDSVEAQLYDRWITERMKALRDLLARRATDALQINDPVLAKQFKDRREQRETEIREREQINREIQREGAQAVPTTLPGSAAPGELRPPATGSGSDTPDQQPAIAPTR